MTVLCVILTAVFFIALDLIFRKKRHKKEKSHSKNGEVPFHT